METSNQAPWHGDEHHGQGGSYVYDPVSGERTLVERTKVPGAQQPGADRAEEKE